MAAKKQWSDLTPTQRRAVAVAGAVEVVLTGVVLRDVHRRTSDQVRGPKALWRLACFVQPFGPIAYLAVGRR